LKMSRGGISQTPEEDLVKRKGNQVKLDPQGTRKGRLSS